MDRRLFEDLVVSTPATPRRRRAAVLPVSVALHAGTVALALLVPVLRPGALPESNSPLPVWKMTIARRTEPPPVRTETPPRADRIPPPRSPEQLVREVTPPAAAAGPAAPVTEPDFMPVGDPPAPCFVNCNGDTSIGSGDGPSGASDPAGEAAGTGIVPVRPGGNIQPPQRTVYVAPVFPAIAIAARVSAVVVLECTIDPTGHVTDARVVTGHPLLDGAVLAAVRQWRYSPTRLNGVPVPVLLTVTVRFQPRR